MTTEENFCLEECGRNIYFECNNTCKNLLNFRKGLAEGRKEGYEQGKNNERELQCGKKNYEKDIARLEKELAECRESALKELVERVEKDQSERQVQTINVIELKAIIKEMGVDL